MRRYAFNPDLSALFWFVTLILAAIVESSAAEPADSVGLAIADFTYSDTSGEVADQVEPHRERLQAFMTDLRHDYQSDLRYHLVPVSCHSACLDDEDPELGELVRIAKAGGAKLLMVGGIHKMSTLVQWARVRVIDLTTDSAVIDRLFTFRGDTNGAWSRAESFISREVSDLMGAPAAAARGPAVIRLAVFDFELQDFSAGASATKNTTSDIERLSKVSSDARRLFTQSRRYSLVDVEGAQESAAKTHTLRSCDGCEAAIAEKLGADQSFIGVVSRISRTEYTIKFQMRDAHTGALLRDADSGLRMGADYSWSRGAIQLITDRVLQER